MTLKEVIKYIFICFISLSLFECFYDVNVQTGCLLLLKVLNLLKQKKICFVNAVFLQSHHL